MPINDTVKIFWKLKEHEQCLMENGNTKIFKNLKYLQLFVFKKKKLVLRKIKFNHNTSTPSGDDEHTR